MAAKKLVPLLAIILLSATASACSSSESQSTVLPTYYQAGLFYVQPVTTTGDTLRFLADTGGGLYLYSDTAERVSNASAPNDTLARWMPLPPFQEGLSIPSPNTSGGLLPLRPRQDGGFRNDRDGMLGHVWFAKRTWTLDYGKEQILLHSPDSTSVRPSEHVELLFRRNQWNQRTYPYPTVNLVIERDTLRFLFDTGATLVLTDTALSELNDGLPRRRGTSFVVASVFDRWRKQHPEWRVIENADSISGEAHYGEYEPIIEVPQITIGGQTVGPVWFTRRNDERFLKVVAPIAGSDVRGALGGSALQYFRVYLDYPDGIAAFDKNE